MKGIIDMGILSFIAPISPATSSFTLTWVIPSTSRSLPSVFQQPGISFTSSMPALIVPLYTLNKLSSPMRLRNYFKQKCRQGHWHHKPKCRRLFVVEAFHWRPANHINKPTYGCQIFLRRKQNCGRHCFFDAVFQAPSPASIRKIFFHRAVHRYWPLFLSGPCVWYRTCSFPFRQFFCLAI